MIRPQHDTARADAFDLGRMACMTTPKSVRPPDVCPFPPKTVARLEWLQGFAEEKADAYYMFDLMLKRTN